MSGDGTHGMPRYDDSLAPADQALHCDECHHPGEAHLWAPALGTVNPQAELFVYEQATCWAENICRECAPELHARVLAMLPAERPGAPQGLEAAWDHGLW